MNTERCQCGIRITLYFVYNLHISSSSYKSFRFIGKAPAIEQDVLEGRVFFRTDVAFFLPFLYQVMSWTDRKHGQKLIQVLLDPTLTS